MWRRGNQGGLRDADRGRRPGPPAGVYRGADRQRTRAVLGRGGRRRRLRARRLHQGEHEPEGAGAAAARQPRLQAPIQLAAFLRRPPGEAPHHRHPREDPAPLRVPRPQRPPPRQRPHLPQETSSPRPRRRGAQVRAARRRAGFAQGVLHRKGPVREGTGTGPVPEAVPRIAGARGGGGDTFRLLGDVLLRWGKAAA